MREEEMGRKKKENTERKRDRREIRLDAMQQKKIELNVGEWKPPHMREEGIYF